MKDTDYHRRLHKRRIHFQKRKKEMKEHREVNFAATAEDRNLIEKIVRRLTMNHPSIEIDELSAEMDLTAAHLNGNPLRLADLLAADTFNFLHDVIGIRDHINRETGELEDGFLPRFTRHSGTEEVDLDATVNEEGFVRPSRHEG